MRSPVVLMARPERRWQTRWNGLVLRSCLALSLAALGLGIASAQEGTPEIAVELGADEIYTGETVDYYVEIRHVENPSPPDLSALQELFEVVPNGDESRNQSSVFIINGRKSEQHRLSHVYRFRLTPRESGTLTIPPPTATAGGKSLKGRSLSLRVIPPEEQEVVVAELTVGRERVYPTQPFTVTLRVLVRPLPDAQDRDPLLPLRRQPPHLEASWIDPAAGLSAPDKNRWLQSLLADNGAGFSVNEVTVRSGSVFDGPRAALFSLARGREEREGLDGRPVNYFVYELSRTFTPERTGEYRFGPSLVKGTFVEGSEERSYTGRKLVAVTPVATVSVREVPTPRPASYCGAIGNYKIAASAHPVRLRVGDPLTLTVELRRAPDAGSLDLVSAPDLASNPRFAEDFEVIDQRPTGRVEGEAKRFAYALRPRRAEVALPAVAVSVFNPETEKFTEITADPIALEVSGGESVGVGDLVGGVGGSSPQELRSSAQGVYQNVTDPRELSDQRVPVRWLIGAVLAGWLAFGTLAALVTVRRRQASDSGYQRRKQARRIAKGRLAEGRAALAQNDHRRAHRAVRDALVGLIADMRNLVAQGLTAADVDSALAEAQVPQEARSKVRRLLETIEAAEYGEGGSETAAAMLQSADNLIADLARALERRG
ncbi:MAG: BatD family protein [Planctomycetales bacterium]